MHRHLDKIMDLKMDGGLKVKGIDNIDKGIYASCVWGSEAKSVYTGLLYPC